MPVALARALALAMGPCELISKVVATVTKDLTSEIERHCRL